MSERLSFFAAREELQKVMTIVEGDLPLRYATFGSHSQSQIPNYLSCREIPDFGISENGKVVGGRSYLLGDQRRDFEFEYVVQRRGGPRYVLDQARNPDSVIMSPGGSFGDECLIAGYLSTLRVAPIFLCMKKILCANFERRGAYFVGRDAAKLCRSGIRLITTHAGEDPLYDFMLGGE